MLEQEWQLDQVDKEKVERLSSQFNISPVVTRILINRGFTTTDEIEEFLEIDLEDLHSPFLFKDMKVAVNRIEQALKNQEQIGIFGDYDVDGITSTALLINYFRELGVEPLYHLPNRLEEGYGLNQAAIEDLAEQGVELLITVDCGISDYQEIEVANQLGIDVIITDHHEVPDRVPQATAIINAKQEECNYPFRELCGVGIAYKLITALARRDEDIVEQEIKEQYLDLVSVGTVADIVSLVDENRIIVKYGLELLNNAYNLGLDALVEVIGLGEKELTTGRVGYLLAPRINAAGRIGDPDLALELLTTDQPEQLIRIAEKLDEINQERQDIEAEILAEAERMIEGIDLEETRVLVLASRNWHSGVVGIVASRIQEKYYRPTIMIAIDDDGLGKGSARSIKNFNIYHAIKNSAHLLPNYGGHEQAAGLSIAEEDITEFRAEINQYAAKEMSTEDLQPYLKVDAEVEIAELDHKLVDEINYLAPFGLANPQPKLAIRDISIESFRTIGDDNTHLKLTISDQQGTTVDCIGFNMADYRERLLSQQDGIDIAGRLGLNCWRGEERLQVNIKDIKFPHRSFVDELFAKSDQVLNDDYYCGIGEEENFYTKIVGVTFAGRQELIKELTAGEMLQLVREPENEYDSSAIKVETKTGEQLGYLNADLAHYLAPYLDVGFEYRVMVSEITGGDEQNLGVNIFIERMGCQHEVSSYETQLRRNQLESLSRSQLLDEIRTALLGDYDFRAKQKEVLSSLEAGDNTLAIFGTGRGKSAIFQSYAALQALAEEQMTIILYPLRALVNDQFEALQAKLAPLGLEIYKANGSLSVGEREKLKTALQENRADIILTTPEFLEYHLDKFSSLTDQIGFLVVDESHHISMSSTSFRPAYRRLDRLSHQLDYPLTLAVTATANDQVAQEITELLGIEQIIVDPHVRQNLEIIDQRNCSDKDQYLTRVLKSGEKSIIYVNSRKKSIELADQLRSNLPQFKDEIAFYNAGLSNRDRNQVETKFRSGELRAIVSTSAFGEGIDIPDIRNIILYHLNFNLTEFNQQSGRVSRDGKPGRIHLLFGSEDVKINQFILDSMAPQREVLVQLYYILRQSEDKEQQLTLSNQELATRTSQRLDNEVRDNTISAGLGILEDLGLLTRIQEAGERTIQLYPAERKLDLADSLRYQEGLEDKKAFHEFKQFALQESAEKLLSVINQPIYPTTSVETKEEE
ncbi:MAG: single-stranded-DNA-specific exonuclease RecJ [Bacillota bacterium]